MPLTTMCPLHSASSSTALAQCAASPSSARICWAMCSIASDSHRSTSTRNWASSVPGDVVEFDMDGFEFIVGYDAGAD